MNVTNQMESSTSRRPRVCPAKTVEILIFLRCRQSLPQAVIVAVRHEVRNQAQEGHDIACLLVCRYQLDISC